MTRARRRFYSPDPIADSLASGFVMLPEGESHHLLDVLRIEPGEVVEIFDARGEVWLGRSAGRRDGRAAIEPLERVAIEVDGGPVVHLALSLLKRRAMDWAVEKLSELGVASLQPLVARRTAVEAPKDEDRGAIARWERIAVAAAKQCGRARPMAIEAPIKLDAWLARDRPESRRCFAHASVESIPIALWLESSERRRSEGADRRGEIFVVAVGPEGGWMPEETAALQASGFARLDLGPLTLRAETAAIAAAAACRLHGASPERTRRARS